MWGSPKRKPKQQGFAVKTSVFQFRELGKAQAMGELAGLFKLVVEEGSGKLLGAHIAGAHASDLIAEANPRHPAWLHSRDLFETIHAHPTISEGIYEAGRFAGIAFLRSCRRHKLEGSRTPFFSGCGCLFVCRPFG